ncbi:uncharacterized protein LOC121873677 isoform X2 [Homarus americanus]|uniref:Uncharacterized protein n=2 Tax=Homarus americanus TaxID=6706 RepID=A0A8J5JWS0_HOMAM|nr:uncharacterized protein LOC121873677 isoform X2 [Homarus americanus]XP_042233296.1 uncharacterized protein LOC121873677 isoform X2 [Homarus americanus]XP_042233297.1 uncharacterized protein LOC121873677 isoform X2 [Homarus americanus]XP_042233298.1 uncharacterized protein LOC121873677 isoform X2 [Homarus americanus]KAG7162658.1 hypothetical protein Hamer_G019376 [Homarus americanus]
MAAAGVLEEAWDEKLVKDYLQKAAKVTPPPRVDHKQFIEASNKFPVKFPTQTARVQTHVKNGKDVKKLTEHINTARPVLHHRCLPLFASFLHHKRTYGTSTEKAVYDGMDMVGLVDRLLHKRPITFFGRLDQYLLRDTTQSKGGFEKIGTDQETPPLCLADYLSYDEIKLSALLSVSSPSFFINDGNRKNKGVPGAPGSYQEEGVVVGMVGARLKKAGFMEWQDCVVSRDQNTREGGYGGVGEPPHLQHLWSHMWRTTLPVWDKVSTRSEEFFKFGRENYVNVPVYKARIQLTAETLLAEAKSRAMSAGLKAYIHVVGLGLGVWRACHEQDAMFVDAWGAALQACDTSQVAHVDFSWIGADQCQGVGDGEVFPDTGVVIHFSKRSLHDHVPKGTLLVVSYAWDGNAFPGNEYWIGKLASTGDGAAACSTGVAELHNSHINANVCGTNLHVAGPWGVMHVGEYASRALSKLSSHKKLKITPE